MNETLGLDENTHVILISHDSSRARLGWVSAATGFTYCGICLRSCVTPQTGSSCPACRARVAYVFDYSSTPEAMRHAWKEISLGRQAETDFSEPATGELVGMASGSNTRAK
jgi:hypothetical protein